VLHPPVTPPYLLLLFYTVSSISALVDLSADIVGYAPPGPFWILGDIFRALIPIFSLWIGGTFSMEAVLPAPNVAREKDVGLHLVVPESTVPTIIDRSHPTT
jgi:hypothetical protein